MKIQISNFRGLTDLSVEFDRILLLAGINEAGKSSACQAIGAAASGSLLPFDGMTKKSASLLVHDNAAAAYATIVSDTGAVQVAWPAVERSTEGRFADASAVAVGLEDLCAARPVERASRLIELIGAKPTHEDFAAAMAELGFKPEVDGDFEDVTEKPSFVEDVWKQVGRGWDNAHAHFKEKGAKTKGAWERATGERGFGVDKAAAWRPRDWSLSLEGASVADLGLAVEARRDGLAELQQRAGADAATLERLRGTAESLPEERRKLHEATIDLTGAEAKARFASGALDRLGAKPVLGAAALQCPCCGASVRLAEGALEAADAPLDQSVAESALAAYEAAEAALGRARETRDLANTYVRLAQGRVDAAEKAAADLAAQPSGTVPAERIAEAVQALALAERSCAMKKLVLEALGLLEEIKGYIAVVKLLAADGLRQKVLVERLAEFNGRLVDNCRAASWPPVHIDADMSISYGGRPFSLCSAGAQFRVRCIVQISVAQVEDAPLLIIDGADILDRAGRNGLLHLLDTRCPPAVVGMTILKEAEMPNLAAAGIGISVWIANGALERARKVAA